MKICGLEITQLTKLYFFSNCSRLFGYWIISEKKTFLWYIVLGESLNIWWYSKLIFLFLSLFFFNSWTHLTWTGKSGFSFCHIKFNVLGYVYYFGATKQIIYCVKVTFLKCLYTIFIYNYTLWQFNCQKYLFLLNQNTRCLWATYI